MKRFVEGENRQRMILLPDCLDDYVVEDNPVRVIDVFIDELDLAALGFEGMLPATTGRPAYHPATLLKIYLYGYLNRIQSSRRLERETGRNIELMWLTGRLMPDFKTIADFRKDNGAAIRAVCRQFMVLCRRLNLFTEAVIAVDGSKFKAVNNRDKNFTPNKIQRRMEQIEASIGRYMAAMDAADRQEGEVAQAKSARLKDKIASLKQQMQQFRELQQAVQAAPGRQISLTDPDARSMATSGKGTGIVGYNVQTLSMPSTTSLWPMRSRIMVTIVTSFQTWGGWHKPPQTVRCSPLLPTGAISKARKSWPVKRRVSRPSCPNR
jgi:transposase